MHDVGAVMFDLFGTIVNYNAARSEMGLPQTHKMLQAHLPGLRHDALAEQVEAVFSELDDWSLVEEQEYPMSRAIEMLLQRLDVELKPDERDELTEAYIRDWAVPISPVSGVNTFLRSLSDRYPLAVITNTHYEPMIERILTAMDIRSYFKVVVTSIGYGRPKPHKTIFHHACDRLGVKPSKCVYVGDSYTADYLGGKEAGMNCFLIGRHARVPKENSIPTVLDLPIHLFK